MPKFLILLISLAGLLLADEAVIASFDLPLDESAGRLLRNRGSVKIEGKIANPERVFRAPGRKNGLTALRFRKSPEGADPMNRKHGCVIIHATKQDFDFSGPFTISLWARPDADLKRDARYVLFSTFSGDHGNGIQLSYAWNAFRCDCGSKAKPASLAVNYRNNPLEFGVWNHFCAVYDGSILRLYLNGIPSDVLEVKIQPASSYFSVGAFLGGYAYPFYGEIASLKIYPAALTAKQIIHEYRNE
jgi:hypothetical protein